MLTLLKETGYRQTPSGSKRKMGLFQCSCGRTKEVSLYNVKSGEVKSCGCLSIKQITYLGKLTGKDKGSYRHGMFGTRFYNTFFNIKDRCNNPKSVGKKYYYDKGIKCLWSSFEDFKKDMYESYLKHIKDFGEKNTTIDRLESSKNYYKENCRWATYQEQAKEKVGRTELVYNIKHMRKFLDSEP